MRGGPGPPNSWSVWLAAGKLANAGALLLTKLTLSERRARSFTLLVCVAEKSRVWRARGMFATMAFRVAEKPCRQAATGQCWTREARRRACKGLQAARHETAATG